MIHAWFWQGKWHVVRDNVVLFVTMHRCGAVDWIHGYTGRLPTKEQVHD